MADLQAFYQSSNDQPRPMTAPASSLRPLRTLRLTLHPFPPPPPPTLLLDASAYLQTYVDPFLAPAIAAVLQNMPDADALPMFLARHFEGVSPNVDTATPKRKATKQDRLYAAKSLSPILESLLARLLAARPENVKAFAAAFCAKYEPPPAAVKPAANPSTAAPTPASAPTPAPALASLLPPAMTLLLLGNAGAGKTTLVETLLGSSSPGENKPTVGFNPVKLQAGDCKVTFYDVGGGVKIRGIWNNYFPDCHAVIYVMDGAGDDVAFKNDVELFKSSVGSHPFLVGKPLLLLLNKKDVKGCRTLDELSDAGISLADAEKSKAFNVTLDCKRVPGGDGATPDASIDAGLEWIMDVVAKDFKGIAQRVKADLEATAKQAEADKIEKDRRVMAKCICKGFGVGGESVEDMLGETDGEEFLAMEIGRTSGKELEEEGREIARLVGYQKLAMMMVGGMVAPISSKKKKWTWAEVKEYVLGIRATIEGL